MNKSLWRRIAAIGKIKLTIKQLKEKGLMYSEERFLKEIMRANGVGERTAKEYLKEAEANPLEVSENALSRPLKPKFEEQRQL